MGGLSRALAESRAKKSILIFVDNREAKNRVVDALAAYDCTLQPRMLLVGDYVVSDRVCIERKVTDDFISSIIDKRLFDQMKALKENFEKPLLIIEGPSLYGRSGLTPNAIRGALATIAIDWGIPIIWTADETETAGMIYWLARREQVDLERSIAIREKKPRMTMAELQEYVVSGLPGISITLARRLLKRFRTIRNVITADEEKLREVAGIGPEKAKRLREVSEAEYQG
ncbi:MAG: ERCC4 domain-containing protein [Candidatus Aenigmatarchaeota archaeon]|nr:hypothetical protein [Candidatus Aenigmarchaeota archaeon]